MTDTPENPPAFPFGQNWTMPDGEPMWKNHDGMTLRDWFAGQALAGMLSNYKGVPDLSAKDAFKYADAMLRARAIEEQSKCS